MKTIADVLLELHPEVLKKYDFSNATYKGALVPIENIRCPFHGVFQQYSAQLRKNGATCPTCGAEQRARSLALDADQFLTTAENTHPGKYTYENTCYVNMRTKVTVRCRAHGLFDISPIKLIHGGQGCPDCGALLRGKRRTDKNVGAAAAETSKNKFRVKIAKLAGAVHKDTYVYHPETYNGMRAPMKITCPKHGDFWQGAYDHVRKKCGCPNCGQKSSGEDAVAKFLSIFTAVERRDRNILKPKELDIVLPEHKLAVEYCGMFWHSHGDKKHEKDNKTNHINKYMGCQKAGIRLITMYETEWLERPRQVKRILRAAIGKLRGRVLARKCEVRAVGSPEAHVFYDKYHVQGGTGNGDHYGLYWRGKLVACMRFTLGSNDRGSNTNREWTLSRYATRVNVVGGASKLFTAFLRDKNPPSVKSFSDNRYYSGGMYEQLGFTLERENKEDYQVWSPKLGLRPKPHYQRRVLQKRLEDHGVQDTYDHDADTRTEAEMTYLMGARRIYDCGKKSWRWTT